MAGMGQVLCGYVVPCWRPHGALPDSWLGQCLTNYNLSVPQSWGNLLELVYNHHPDALPCLQDLLQPVDVVGIGVSERDIVRQAGDLHRVGAVPDELIGHHDGPVQAQSLSCKGRAEDTAPALPTGLGTTPTEGLGALGGAGEPRDAAMTTDLPWGCIATSH